MVVIVHNQKRCHRFSGLALSDPDYKNRVANAYFLAYDVFLPEIETFKTQAEEIIMLIEERK